MGSSSSRPVAAPRAASRVLCALLAALTLGIGCGPSREPDAAPGEPGAPSSGGGARDAARSAAGRPAAPQRIWPHEDLPELFGAVVPQLDEQGQAESVFKDAALDDWDSEVLHDRLRPVLDGALAALLAGDDAAWLAHLAEADFEGADRLRPEPRATVYERESARVERALAQPGEGSRLDAAALTASGAALREVLGPPPGARCAPLIVAVETPEAGRALTRVLLQFDGGAAAAPVQINATWELTWALSDGLPPRILALRVLRHEEVHAAGVFFADASVAAFGATPGWESELQRGVDDYFMRIDRQAGVAFQGMQGLAVGDVDGDGLEDVYVCQQVGLPNRLYLRRPDGSVVERAAQAKLDYLDVTRSALLVDLNNDGHRDIVLAVANAIVVGFNDGKGVFSRQKPFPAEGAEQFYSLCAADADNDGDLDIYGCRYALGGVMHGAPVPYHDADNGAANVYLRNDGRGQFSDATEESGLGVNNRKFSLSALWEDFDADGDLDLYVVNDFGRNNLYVNDGSGHFVDRAGDLGLQDIGAGMGAACSDYDLDGDLDVYVTNMFSAAGLRTAGQERFLGGRDPQARPAYVKHARGNSLLRNRGDGTFEDVTEASGTALGRWAWGAKFLDFDSDGYDDLFVPNGQTTSRRNAFDLESFFWRQVIDQSPVDESSLPGYRSAFDTIQNLMMFGGLSWNGNERNNAYLNLGDGSFAEVSHVSGTGFVEDSRSAAVLDWDDDGREDLLVRSRTAPRLRLLLNRTGGAPHSATFELVGRRCNRDAVGARVTLTAGGVARSKRVTAGDGYLAQSSLRLTFGLASSESIERVLVSWPDGSSSTFEDLPADRHYLVDQGTQAPQARPRRPASALAGSSFPPNLRSPAPVDRVVLMAPLPLAVLELPALEGPARRVADFGERLVFLHVFTGGDESGRQALAELAAAAPALEAAGVAVVCLTNDEGPALARARKTLAETPFLADAGYVDGRTREALSIIALEVLGFFDRVPLPLSLLFDRQGRACVLYLGPPDPAQVRADAEILAAAKPRRSTAHVLAGGRWMRPQPRNLRALHGAFASAGFEDLSAYLESILSARQAGAAANESDDDQDG